MVGAGIEVVIVLTGGALAAPCGAAIWTVTAVEGTTALTAAGCSALAVAGAAGATAGANFGNAPNQQSHNSHGRKSERRDVHSASKQRGVCFFLSQKSCQMAASGRTCSVEHQKTQTRAETTNNSRPELC